MTIARIPGLEDRHTQQNDKINEIVAALNALLAAGTGDDTATAIAAAPNKGTIHDNDEFAGADSEASGALKTWLWSTIKSTLATWAASVVLTFTNKTFDANGTGNAISNLETADFAANVVDTDGTLAADSDTRLASQKAVKTYVDALPAPVSGLVQIATATPTSGTALDFLSLPQTYSALVIVFEGLSGSSGISQLWMRYSTDNGSSFASSSGNYINSRNGATPANATELMMEGNTSNAASARTGMIIITGYALSRVKVAKYISAVGSTGGAGFGVLNTTSPIDAIRLSGLATFDAGTVTVFGMA